MTHMIPEFAGHVFSHVAVGVDQPVVVIGGQPVEKGGEQQCGVSPTLRRQDDSQPGFVLSRKLPIGKIGYGFPDIPQLRVIGQGAHMVGHVGDVYEVGG